MKRLVNICLKISFPWQIKSVVVNIGPPLWSSGQSSWLQIQRSRVLQEKKTVVGLERGPVSLVSTTEELIGRNSIGSGLEI
jgi:hypothetical protein